MRSRLAIENRVTKHNRNALSILFHLAAAVFGPPARGVKSARHEV